MARTNAWLEPWFLNAKLAYHRANEARLREALIRQALEQIATINELQHELRQTQALERRLQEVSRG